MPNPQRGLSPWLSALSFSLWSASSPSRVSGTDMLLPSRMTSRAILVPGVFSPTSICNWPASVTFLPSSSVMTSPIFRPALAPGESGSTCVMTAPLLSFTSKNFAFSGVTSVMPTPI